MYFNKEAATKQSDEKKNRSPDRFIFSAVSFSSVFLAHEKQTDEHPAKMANPAFVMDVVSKEVLPNVMRINKAPERNINTRKAPINTFNAFLIELVIN
jgi:hypothetical protein